MSGRNLEQLAEAASHEGGHVVAGYAASLRLQQVRLIWVGNHWEGDTKFDDNYNPPWRTDCEQRARVDMAVALAGPTAERLRTGSADQNHCSCDYAMAKAIRAEISRHRNDTAAGFSAYREVGEKLENLLLSEPYVSAVISVQTLLQQRPMPAQREVVSHLNATLGQPVRPWAI